MSGQNYPIGSKMDIEPMVEYLFFRIDEYPIILLVPALSSIGLCPVMVDVLKTNDGIPLCRIPGNLNPVHNGLSSVVTGWYPTLKAIKSLTLLGITQKWVKKMWDFIKLYDWFSIKRHTWKPRLIEILHGEVHFIPGERDFDLAICFLAPWYTVPWIPLDDYIIPYRFVAPEMRYGLDCALSKTEDR